MGYNAIVRCVSVECQYGIALGLVIAHPHVVSLLVLVALNEGEFGACSGPSGHGILDLKGTNLYELVDHKVSNTLLEVVLV